MAFSTLLDQEWDIALVIDADSVVDPNLVTEVRGAFCEGAEAVQVRYAVFEATSSLAARVTGIAFAAFNVLRPRGRQRWGLSVGISGNGFAVSREIAASIPFRETSLVEDLEFHIDLVRAGYRVSFVDRPILRAEFPNGGLGDRAQRSRWEGGRLRVMITRALGLLGDVLKGRLRLLEPLLDLCLPPLSLYVMLLLGLLALPFAWSRIVSSLALSLVALHLLAAIAVAGKARDLPVLLLAPFYLVWKVMMTLPILRTALRGEWVRTRREGE